MGALEDRCLLPLLSNEGAGGLGVRRCSSSPTPCLLGLLLLRAPDHLKHTSALQSHVWRPVLWPAVRRSGKTAAHTVFPVVRTSDVSYMGLERWLLGKGTPV